MKKSKIEEIKNGKIIQIVHQLELIKGGSGLNSETEVVKYQDF